MSPTLSMRARLLPVLIACAATPCAAGDAPPPAPVLRVPEIRLTTLKEGMGTPRADGDVAKAAKAVGMDLARPPHPLVAHRFLDAQVFYVFCKTTTNAFGDRPYVIQRIKKTERSWLSADGAPEERVTYLVEAFKTLAGALKQEDQHFGNFHLGKHVRREVIKEYELGFGEVPGVCEGTAWPFAADSLYQRIQPYQLEIGLYEKTKLRAVRPWTLTVSFDRSGTYRVASPELGFDLPSKTLDPAVATPPPDATSKDVVLERGVGTLGTKTGTSTAEDLVQALGPPLEDVPAGKDHRLMSFARSLTCNLDPSGQLKTVITRPGFAGRTKEGVAHGSTRGEVVDKLGAAANAKLDDETWTFDGLVVSFDGFDRVSRLVLFRKKP